MSERNTGHMLDPNSADMQERIASVARYAQAGRLADSVTHDINNLLGAAVAYTELVSLDKGLSAESRRMLGEVANSLMRGSAMMSALTALTRPETRTANAVDVSDLVRRTLQLVAYFLKRERVEVQEHLPPAAVSVVGDAPCLQIALLHLLANAREALALLPAAERQLHLEVSGGDDFVEATIWNAGPVPHPDILARMFTPHFTTKPPPHLGLGLHAARAAAELHDGTLEFDAGRGFVLRVARYPAFARKLRGADDKKT